MPQSGLVEMTMGNVHELRLHEYALFPRADQADAQLFLPTSIGFKL
jgi:hypothetical protein